MNHFEYLDGELFAEEVPVARIAREVGTPFYCYSSATLRRHYTVFRDALTAAGLDVTVCFACKANPNTAVIRTLAQLGAGADVVSEGELRQALAGGVEPGKIVFSGVGKTRDELDFAVATGILQINVESEPELRLLSEVAAARGVRMPISIRINPDVDAGTHAKITTGKKENKFGIEWSRVREVYALAASLPGIEVVGIACHIGSQLTDLEPFRLAFMKVREMVATLRADGITISRLDLGGGVGVPYADETPPSPTAYARVIAETLGDLGCRFVVEPGRLLVGNAGILVSRVIHVKEGETRTFLIVDAAMNDLMRPALYDAHHGILPVHQPRPGETSRPVDVVGPVCETGDTFATQRVLPPLGAGDLIAFCTAGAYGAAMSSTYNTRPLIPEVLVKDDAYHVIRARPGFEAMRALESLPDWL